MDTREELKRKLKKPPREDIYRNLERTGHIQEFEDPEEPYTIKNLVKEYKAQEEIFEPSNPFRRSPGAPPKKPLRLEADKRGEALAAVLEHYVDTMPAVVNFRKKYRKKSRPETIEQVSAWIEKKAKAEALDQGKFDHTFHNPFFDPNGDMPLIFEVKSGGALDALDQAATAVLRNLKPAVDRDTAIFCVMTGRVELTRVFIDWNINYLFRTLSRITLIIDPRLKPTEIADLYKTQQDRFAGWLFGNTMRGRPMESKTLRLAVFMDSEYRASRTWLERLKLWNATCDDNPEERYDSDNIRNFQRDAKRAWQGVTGSNLDRRQYISEYVANDPFWKLELKNEE